MKRTNLSTLFLLAALFVSCGKISPVEPDLIPPPHPLRHPDLMFGVLGSGEETTYHVSILSRGYTMSISFYWQPIPPDAIAELHIFRSLEDWSRCYYGDKVCKFVASSVGDSQPQTLQFTNGTEGQEYFVTAYNKGPKKMYGNGVISYINPIN